MRLGPPTKRVPSLPYEPLLAARCYAAIGFLVSQGLQHQDEALSAFDAAEKLLEHVTEKDSDEWVAAWLSVHEAALSSITGGTPSRQKRCSPGNGRCWKQEVRRLNEHCFTAHLGHVRARASRYRVDESIVSDFRAAKAAAEELGGQSTVVGAEVAHTRCWAYWHLGFALWWHGDIQAALVELGEALRAADRTGNKLLEVLARSFMTLAYFRQGNVGAVKEMAPPLGALATAMALPENVGVATATMSWVAWKEGRVDEVEALAQEALESWEGSVRRYPLDWICLFPLISVQLSAGKYKEATAAARKLLAPHQTRLPDELEAAVESAIGSWDSGQADLAAQRLEKAVKLAEQFNLA